MSNAGSIRATQRAPKSCLPCSTRKVKCDKAFPCSTCVRRGEPEACIRETVMVRGTIRTIEPAEQDTARPRPRRRPENDDPLEDALWEDFASTSLTRSTVLQWDDIMPPSRRTSERLVEYDRVWNSWVHFALEYPQFEQECNDYILALEDGVSLESLDAAWMAVYFSVLCAALLMMDDKEAEQLLRSEQIASSVMVVSRMWYDAAIFCLERAEFMRTPSICTVQAVAVLSMCFNLFGDAELGHHMRSSAIRVARRIGLHTSTTRTANQQMSVASRNRLWWTLVICEWFVLGTLEEVCANLGQRLNVQYDTPLIEEADFDLPLPAPTTPQSDDSDIDPVQYHAFMARTARVYHRFFQSVARGSISVPDAVRVADEELALLIDTLPAYLQPGAAHNASDDCETCQTYPWLKWQRFDVTLVLLHHRIRINRTLQRQWLSAPDEFRWARSISVKSALDIIWISRNWDQPISQRKQWALSFHLFVASILLLREWRSCSAGQGQEYREAIENAILMLDDVKTHSAVARHAIEILRRELDSSGHHA
ncbi:hypothetical protein CC79DRAFT_845803 [Sarocladium strictum]